MRMLQQQILSSGLAALLFLSATAMLSASDPWDALKVKLNSPITVYLVQGAISGKLTSLRPDGLTLQIAPGVEIPVTRDTVREVRKPAGAIWPVHLAILGAITAGGALLARHEYNHYEQTQGVVKVTKYVSSGQATAIGAGLGALAGFIAYHVASRDPRGKVIYQVPAKEVAPPAQGSGSRH
ncbi:MAG: hypothetical protein ACRD2D_14530 [Terriglobales bacterium]